MDGAPRPSALVVDDEPDIREWLRVALDLAGWDVADVADGTAALRRISGEGPNLVVIDYRMPGLDGQACIAELRKRGVRSNIVLFSAFFGREAIQLPTEWNVIPIAKDDGPTLLRICKLLHDTTVAGGSARPHPLTGSPAGP